MAMLKLIPQPDVVFVPALIEAVEYEGSCQSPTETRVWVRLSSKGVIFETCNGKRKVIVTCFGAVSVDYTFRLEDGIQGPRKTTTTEHVSDLAKEIVNYLTEEKEV